MKPNRHGNAGMMTIFKVIWTAFQEDPRPRGNFRLTRNIETSSAYLAISTFHHQNCRNPKGVDWTCYYECTLKLFVSTTNAFLLPLRPKKVYTPTTWFKRYSPCRNEWCGEGDGGRGRASCIGNSWSSKSPLPRPLSWRGQCCDKTREMTDYVNPNPSTKQHQAYKVATKRVP